MTTLDASVHGRFEKEAADSLEEHGLQIQRIQISHYQKLSDPNGQPKLQPENRQLR